VSRAQQLVVDQIRNFVIAVERMCEKMFDGIWEKRSNTGMEVARNVISNRAQFSFRKGQPAPKSRSVIQRIANTHISPLRPRRTLNWPAISHEI